MALIDLLSQLSHQSTALPLLALLVICIPIYIRYHNGLGNIPGPFLNSITVLPRILSFWRGNSHNDDLRLHQKYGKLVRVAPNSISVSDVLEIDKLYGINSKFYKSPFFEPVTFYDEEGIIPDPFVLKDKALHSRMKRNAANAYSLNALVQLEPLVEGVIQRLINKLTAEFADVEQACDIGQELHCFAMDAIFTVTFGKDLQFVEAGDSKKMLKTLDESQAYMVAGVIPWVHKFLTNKYVAKILPSSGNNAPFFEELMNIAISETEALKGKAAPISGPITFLQRLLINQENHPGSLTTRELNTHTFGNILAGSDTTSIALRSIILHLLQNPNVYEKLCHEIRNEAKLSLPVPFAVASKLPYLNAVIKESIRLHPSVGMMLFRTVPPGGATLCDTYIPYGTEVGINPWIVHRDPEYYPDPLAFKPERWLTTDEKRLALMNKAFFAFGSGAHTCSGRHISTLEMMKLVPSLLCTFDMKLSQGFQGVKVKNHFFTGIYGLTVRLEKLDGD